MMKTLVPSLKTRWAPAKVNLYIHVGPPAAGGLHPIDSLVVFADTRAADRIAARAHPHLSFTVEGPRSRSLKGAPNNLVLAAAVLLREASGHSGQGAALTLHKSLPIAGGVGGGSSDAAAALHVLNEMWALGFAEAALERLGEQLGSDVPACVRARPLLMRGVGERLSPAWTPDLPAILVNPGVMLETPKVFARFDQLPSAPAFREIDPPKEDDSRARFITSLASYRNDLQPAAIALCPDVGRVLEVLNDDPDVRLARMSGSGPTCFALLESDEAAVAAAERIQAMRKRWWVQPTRLRGSASAETAGTERA